MDDDTFFFLLGRQRGLPQSDSDYPGDGYLWTPKLSRRLRKEHMRKDKMGGICGMMQGYISPVISDDIFTSNAHGWSVREFRVG